MRKLWKPGLRAVPGHFVLLLQALLSEYTKATHHSLLIPF